ncbi:PREDICTED: uncharacterized protein LOC107329379 [Acropora digitifera]|uniref:uncharacterized protein LOC107329379 n=1 Tax=Acropora digitifera TaxID=70779 RepID=UPI00077AC6DF|nr:PREDICTED: uncharacterized protein LOC107329379 [Acropora digitifera]
MILLSERIEGSCMLLVASQIPNVTVLSRLPGSWDESYALSSTFKLQRSRWFCIGSENTFPGFFSQEFFHRFFVSGLTTAELVVVRPIVIGTITCIPYHVVRFFIRLSAAIENRIEDKIKDINFACLRSLTPFL